mgnify:CR=1 FL=1
MLKYNTNIHYQHFSYTFFRLISLDERLSYQIKTNCITTTINRILKLVLYCFRTPVILTVVRCATSSKLFTIKLISFNVIVEVLSQWQCNTDGVFCGSFIMDVLNMKIQGGPKVSLHTLALIA